MHIYRCHVTSELLGTGSFGLLVGQSQTSRPQGDVFFQFPELGDGFLLMFVGVTNRVIGLCPMGMNKLAVHQFHHPR